MATGAAYLNPQLPLCGFWIATTAPCATVLLLPHCRSAATSPKMHISCDFRLAACTRGTASVLICSLTTRAGGRTQPIRRRDAVAWRTACSGRPGVMRWSRPCGTTTTCHWCRCALPESVASTANVFSQCMQAQPFGATPSSALAAWLAHVAVRLCQLDVDIATVCCVALACCHRHKCASFQSVRGPYRTRNFRHRMWRRGDPLEP